MVTKMCLLGSSCSHHQVYLEGFQLLGLIKPRFIIQSVSKWLIVSTLRLKIEVEFIEGNVELYLFIHFNSYEK